MDDLDRLLANVDDDYDLDKIKAEEKIAKAKSARKSDKNIGDETFDEHTSESFDSIICKLINAPELQDFSQDFFNGIKPHWNLTIDFKNLISDLTLPDPVIDALRKYKYNFLRSVELIEKLYDDFVSTKSFVALEKKSKQDFLLFFPASESTFQKISFLVLKELFLRVRELNSKLRREWKNLSSAVSVMSLVNESSSFMAKVEDIVRNGLECCSSTDKLLELIAAVLYIPRKDFDVLEKDIGSRIYFRDDFDYDYRSIFKQQDIDDRSTGSDSKRSKPDNSDSVPLPVSSVPDKPEQVVIHKEPLRPVSQTVPPEITDLYKLPGKSSWNTKEPYITRIDYALYQQNCDDLKNTVLFLDKPKTKAAINALLKRAMIKNLRATADEVLTRDYENFVVSQLANLIHEMEQFINGCDDISSELFLYHCGPQTLFYIIKQHYETTETGYCYRRISDNRISRILPTEYLKFMSLRWFARNIHTKDLQFDKINNFNVIRSFVQNDYTERINAILHKITIAVNHHYTKTGVKKSPQQILVKKAGEFFSVVEIEIYRRFLDRTIFRK